MIKIGNITIFVYNDGCNSASYTLMQEYSNGHKAEEIKLYQSEMELLVAGLNVLVKQNKRKR